MSMQPILVLDTVHSTEELVAAGKKYNEREISSLKNCFAVHACANARHTKCDPAVAWDVAIAAVRPILLSSHWYVASFENEKGDAYFVSPIQEARGPIDKDEAANILASLLKSKAFKEVAVIRYDAQGEISFRLDTTTNLAP